MVYLFAAYTIVWLGVLLYALSIGQKHRRLAQQIEALEAAVAGRNGGRAHAQTGARGV